MFSFGEIDLTAAESSASSAVGEKTASSLTADHQKTQTASVGAVPAKSDGKVPQTRRAVKACPVNDCPGTVEGKKKFCREYSHQQWYEFLEKRTFGRSRGATGKKKELAPLSDEQELEQKSYKTIFGGKDEIGDPVLQQKLFDELKTKYGESPLVCMKEGTKVNMTLTSFVHDRGTRKANVAGNKNPVLDYEIFKKKVQACRPWDDAKVLRTWNDLKKAQPNADHGPMGLELEIPSWMLGGKYKAEYTENFEEKVIRSKKKGAQLSQQEQDEAVNDCQKGFGYIAEVNLQETGEEVNPASLTVDLASKKRAWEIMNSVAGAGAEDESSGAQIVNAVAADSPSGTKKETAESPNSKKNEDSSSVQPTKKNKILDIRIARTDAAHAALATSKDEIQKLNKLISACADELHRGAAVKENNPVVQDACETLEGRANVALCVVGRKPLSTWLRSQESAQYGVDLDLRSDMVEFNKKGGKQYDDPALFHSEMLRSKLASVMRKDQIPIEAPERMPTATQYEATAELMRQAETNDALEDIAKDAEDMLTHLTQLRESLRNSMNQLKKFNDKHATDERKKKETAENEAKAKERAELEQRAAELRRQVDRKAKIGSMSFDWTSKGAKNVTVYKEADLIEAIRAGAVYKTPFVAELPGGMLQVLQNVDEGSMSRILAAWSDSFATCNMAKTLEYATAPATEAKHSISRMSSLWVHTVPDDKCMALGDHPMIKQMVEKLSFVGYTGNYVGGSFENEYFGSVTMYTTGKLHLVMLSPEAVATFLGRLLSGIKSKEALEKALEKSLLSLTAEQVSEFIKGGSLVCHCLNVDCGTSPRAIYSPPGWYTLRATLNQTQAGGIQRFCMPIGSSLAAIIKMLPKNTTLDSLEDALKLKA